jgi:hypothetical protein
MPKGEKKSSRSRGFAWLQFNLHGSIPFASVASPFGLVFIALELYMVVPMVVRLCLHSTLWL